MTVQVLLVVVLCWLVFDLAMREDTYWQARS